MKAPRRQSELEKRRLRKTVREYQAQGYQVTERPAPTELPDFLSEFPPDAIAYGDNETVMIEIMSTASLVELDDLPEIVRKVQEQPGWRFELIVSNPRISTREVDESDNAYANRRETYIRLGKAQTLLESNQLEAALLMAWAAMVATLRSIVFREGIRLRRDNPHYPLKQLVSLAIISREDYDFLLEMTQLRNAIAGGFKASEPDPLLVQKLIQMVISLPHS